MSRKRHLPVKELFDILIGTVDRLGIDYAIGGAVAMAMHGYTRETLDVGVFVRRADVGKLRTALRERGLSIDVSGQPYQYIAYREEDPRDVRIDILVPEADPDTSAIEDPDLIDYEQIKVNVAPVYIIVLSKIYAYDAGVLKSLGDIQEMYARGMFDPDHITDHVRHMDEDLMPVWSGILGQITQPVKTRARPKPGSLKRK